MQALILTNLKQILTQLAISNLTIINWRYQTKIVFKILKKSIQFKKKLTTNKNNISYFNN